MPDWNPELYLKFERERTQPVRDLVARLEGLNPSTILDLGCGPGNSTTVLKECWPQARIVGLDNSASMLEKARKARFEIEWIQQDIGTDLAQLGQFELLFANASLQWLPNHSELMPRLFRLVKPGGALAMQVPKFEEMPIAAALQNISGLPQYAGFFSDFEAGLHGFEVSEYYEALHKLSTSLALWRTDYYHVLENHQAVIDWTSSTGMRPYLERLPSHLHESFKAAVLKCVQQAYPAQSDGRVLFIFKRFFLIACKA